MGLVSLCLFAHPQNNELGVKEKIFQNIKNERTFSEKKYQKYEDKKYGRNKLIREHFWRGYDFDRDGVIDLTASFKKNGNDTAEIVIIPKKTSYPIYYEDTNNDGILDYCEECNIKKF